MRVVGGKYRGRTLYGPKHQGLRPTADRVKEALFNIIGSRIEGGMMLDLFAGTGGMGIEALSRGADLVVFNDFNSQSIKLLGRNIELVKIPQVQFRVFQLPAAKALEVMTKEKMQFDFIFLDPPYEAGLLESVIFKIAESSLLQPTGLLIAEHPDRIELPDEVGPLVKQQIRNYGDIDLSIFVYVKDNMVEN